MNVVTDTSKLFEAERCVHHLVRSNFRITEMQISLTQEEVPWHYQNAGFALGRDRAASKLRSKPDRRDLGTRIVKPGRRDTERRITPELMAFYKMRAKQLRDEAFRDMWRGLWSFLVRMMRPR